MAAGRAAGVKGVGSRGLDIDNHLAVARLLIVVLLPFIPAGEARTASLKAVLLKAPIGVKAELPSRLD